MESALALWISHADDLSYDGVQIEFLPPNTTSLIQPMDQGIIHAFKALYTRNTLQHLVEAMDSDQDFSLKAYWRKYTIASCLQNIQRAIQEMRTETVARGGAQPYRMLS
uniref:DDE-1 domain-containing protein n=1 Tax=Myripristis murdjan TaxID=586833 RepID=A0A667ZJI2_9TELE